MLLPKKKKKNPKELLFFCLFFHSFVLCCWWRWRPPLQRGEASLPPHLFTMSTPTSRSPASTSTLLSPLSKKGHLLFCRSDMRMPTDTYMCSHRLSECTCLRILGFASVYFLLVLLGRHFYLCISVSLDTLVICSSKFLSRFVLELCGYFP